MLFLDNDHWLCARWGTRHYFLVVTIQEGILYFSQETEDIELQRG